MRLDKILLKEDWAFALFFSNIVYTVSAWPPRIQSISSQMKVENIRKERETLPCFTFWMYQPAPYSDPFRSPRPHGCNGRGEDNIFDSPTSTAQKEKNLSGQLLIRLQMSFPPVGLASDLAASSAAWWRQENLLRWWGGRIMSLVDASTCLLVFKGFIISQKAIRGVIGTIEKRNPANSGTLWRGVTSFPGRITTPSS